VTVYYVSLHKYKILPIIYQLTSPVILHVMPQYVIGKVCRQQCGKSETVKQMTDNTMAKR